MTFSAIEIIRTVNSRKVLLLNEYYGEKTKKSAKISLGTLETTLLT
jgi:hypothetical protein